MRAQQTHIAIKAQTEHEKRAGEVLIDVLLEEDAVEGIEMAR